MKNYDVIMKNGWWTIVRSDNKNVESAHATEEQAMENAARLAKLGGGQVVFHNESEFLDRLSAKAEAAQRSNGRAQMPLRTFPKRIV
jgi:hypothetical protein